MPSPTPAAALAAAGGPQTPQPDAPSQEPYRTLFVIGKGGMGTVEVALEQGAGGLERIVALKRLLPEGARDPRHKEMFLREARLAALLAHPNVVHAYAFGELAGELFMAMEYVEGEPLSHFLRAAREEGRGLAAGLVAHILAEVCEGLHAAHELVEHGTPLKVVHRDVSPHNVMIAYDGRVKLLDFGVAKFDASGNETRTGEVKGKMAYMSPQQALGERLDRRSDLYSIGAVLFECLTGQRMWGSGTDLEVMRRLALESPPRLDAAMADAPRALVDLHARLVARDPERRPATARDVAEELRALAASSLPAGDGDAVRARMQALFGPHAERRRTLLTESLQDVAPSRVVRLQHDLGREPRHAGEPRTSTEPLIAAGAGDASAPGRVPSPRRRRWAAATALFLLGAAAIATTAAARRSPTATASSPPAEPASPARAVALPLPTPRALAEPPGIAPGARSEQAPQAVAAPAAAALPLRAPPPAALPFAPFAPLQPLGASSSHPRPAPLGSAAAPAPSGAATAAAPAGSTAPAPGASASAAPADSSAAPPAGSVPDPAASGAPAKLPDVDPTPF